MCVGNIQSNHLLTRALTLFLRNFQVEMSSSCFRLASSFSMTSLVSFSSSLRADLTTSLAALFSTSDRPRLTTSFAIWPSAVGSGATPASSAFGVAAARASRTASASAICWHQFSFECNRNGHRSSLGSSLTCRRFIVVAASL